MVTDVPTITPVLNEETLFRAVRDDPQHFGCDDQGALNRLSQSAFNDRNMQPSVDRATLRVGGAAASRKSEDDGVLALVAGEIRAIKSIISYDAKGRPMAARHQVDVVHCPEADNDAHALVTTAPEISSGSTFKRLKEALCFIALTNGWAFPPLSARR